MVWHGAEPDPTADPAATAVLAAYKAAVEARLDTPACYRAGVEAWRRAHPDHSAAYAGKQAVAVILTVKEKSLMRVE
jgi:hypothetical protein